jgi:Prp8 binding protein
LYSLIGHRDSVTGLRLSPDGSFLLSNAMDSTVRCWDVRPFVAAAAAAPSSAGGAAASVDPRLTQIYKGATHDLEQNLLRCAWSPDGLRVAAGSADKTLNVWEAATGRLLYRLPGHQGAVTDVDFHPNPAEPIVVSASTDKTLFLGEMS